MPQGNPIVLLLFLSPLSFFLLFSWPSWLQVDKLYPNSLKFKPIWIWRSKGGLFALYFWKQILLLFGRLQFEVDSFRRIPSTSVTWFGGKYWGVDELLGHCRQFVFPSVLSCDPILTRNNPVGLVEGCCRTVKQKLFNVRSL